MSALKYYQRGTSGLEEVKLDGRRAKVLEIFVEAIERARARMPPEEFEAAMEQFQEWLWLKVKRH
jgi:hypothetical protein